MITFELLVPMAAKGALVLLIAVLVSLLLFNRSAAFRHLVWTGGLFALLLLPVLSFTMPTLPVPGLAAVIRPVPREIPRFARDDNSHARDDNNHARDNIAREEIAPAGGNGNAGLDISPNTGSPSTTPIRRPDRAPAPSASTAGIDVTGMLPALWLGGSFALLLWLGLGHARARGLVRQSRITPAPEWTDLIAESSAHAGVTGPVEIRESDRLLVPLTIGLFHPVVVVPAEGRDWNIEHRRDVLIHELAHVARRDCLTHTIGWIACALHWFNPLAWLALYRARVEREHACDDVVLAAGARPSAYARELLSTAQVARVPLAAGAASLAMARRSQLTGRLLAILDAHRNRRPATGRGAGFLGVVGLSLVLPVAALAPTRVATTATAANTGMTGSPTTIAAAVEEAATVDRPARIVALPPTSTAAVALRNEPQGQSLCARTDNSHARSVKLNGSMTITGQGNAEDGNGNTWVVWTGIDCSVKILLTGKVTFNAEETDVATLSRGARIEFTHSEGRDDRVYLVRENGGALERRYTVNGREAPINAEIERWRATLVLAYIRRSGYDAEGRTRRIMAASGVDGVLAEIDHIGSDWAAGRYFSAAIATRLDEPATTKVVTAAGKKLESDYELAEVLNAVPVASLAGPSARAAYVEATESIESDYELGRTLARVLSAGPQNPEVTRALLQRAKTMDSDHELSELLLGLVATGTIKGDDAIYLIDGVLLTIESDYEKERVLTALAPAFASDPRLMAQALRTAATIESDHSLSEYLKQVLSVTPLAGELITPFFAAAATIESDYNQQEVLVAALGRSSGPEVVTQVLNASKRIESDHSQAEVLMAAIHRGLTPDQRQLLRRVAEGIESDYDRARVLGALTAQ